eukprot:TRINITY_DN18924_c0_g1_i1.p1 TRINITY_DN18924_c0_g1~~TRINITY_DN18924_c0_g1_i1.p1  ORF type:complete len:219 (-),score=44.92 TRINITY_DN18924_c0_g1_i1:126-707(-)
MGNARFALFVASPVLVSLLLMLQGCDLGDAISKAKAGFEEAYCVGNATVAWGKTMASEESCPDFLPGCMKEKVIALVKDQNTDGLKECFNEMKDSVSKNANCKCVGHVADLFTILDGCCDIGTDVAAHCHSAMDQGKSLVQQYCPQESQLLTALSKSPGSAAMLLLLIPVAVVTSMAVLRARRSKALSAPLLA